MPVKVRGRDGAGNTHSQHGTRTDQVTVDNRCSHVTASRLNTSPGQEICGTPLHTHRGLTSLSQAELPTGIQEASPAQWESQMTQPSPLAPRFCIALGEGLGGAPRGNSASCFCCHLKLLSVSPTLLYVTR